MQPLAIADKFPKSKFTEELAEKRDISSCFFIFKNTIINLKKEKTE